MVARIIEAWTMLLRSSPRVTASRSRLSSRDQSPMYIEGAYCAWSPPIRSSVLGIGAFARSSSICLARSARFRWRSVRTVSGKALQVSSEEELAVAEPPVQLAHRQVVGIVPGPDLGDAVLGGPADRCELGQAGESLAAELWQRGRPLVLCPSAPVVDKQPGERDDAGLGVQDEEASLPVEQWVPEDEAAPVVEGDAVLGIAGPEAPRGAVEVVKLRLPSWDLLEREHAKALVRLRLEVAAAGVEPGHDLGVVLREAPLLDEAQ